MVRFDAGTLTVALNALLIGCGSGSHQPEPPAAVPSPAVQPQANPSTPSAPNPKAEPNTAPKDSAGASGTTYPWQSAPIASL
jgi:hypothetical protein